VIKLESAFIEEVRGIRKLDLKLSRQTFAISGPNGSGKSGVIDAIEFGLTGHIGRLEGRGTKGLSVTEHGPHVDKAKFPDAASVTLRVFLTDLGKSVEITRKIASPSKPKIDPADDDVKAVLAQVADHPEITLSRREILRFILVEPTKRSEEIQALLKLDQLGATRSALNTAQNRLQNAAKTAVAQVESARTALQLHLQIATLKASDLLDAANARRKVLGLALLGELTADTKLDAGVTAMAGPAPFNKEGAVRDVRKFEEETAQLSEVGQTEVDAVLGHISALERTPELLSLLHRRGLVEKGLELIDGDACPLCDTRWGDQQHLRDHLTAKLAKSNEAREVQESLQAHGSSLAQKAAQLAGAAKLSQRAAEIVGDTALAQALSTWRIDLDAFRAQLSNADDLIAQKNRFVTGWLRPPNDLYQRLNQLHEAVERLPEQTSTVDAQTFLAAAQLRLADYREAMRNQRASEIACKRAKTTYDTYCEVLEDELNTLYDDVQKDFSTFYRAINETDESTFTAKLTPTEGSLGLDVNFYERGLFPPGGVS
jgi:DNA repair exonuclease SbcCD ATPase subunit